jgi:hypothetical protein
MSKKTSLKDNGGRRGLTAWENMVRNQAFDGESRMLEMLCGGPKMMMMMMMMMTTTTTTTTMTTTAAVMMMTTMVVINHVRAISFRVKPLTSMLCSAQQ